MRRHTVVPTTVVALSLALFSAAPASAAPTRDSLTINCDNGVSFAVAVAVAGSSQFTPAHILGSTTRLVPTSFGEFTGTFTAPDGSVQTFTQPPTSKGASGRPRATTTSCTYHIQDTSADGTFVGDGSVTGFLTPVH